MSGYRQGSGGGGVPWGTSDGDGRSGAAAYGRREAPPVGSAAAPSSGRFGGAAGGRTKRDQVWEEKRAKFLARRAQSGGRGAHDGGAAAAAMYGGVPDGAGATPGARAPPKLVHRDSLDDLTDSSRAHGGRAPTGGGYPPRAPSGGYSAGGMAPRSPTSAAIGAARSSRDSELRARMEAARSRSSSRGSSSGYPPTDPAARFSPITTPSGGYPSSGGHSSGGHPGGYGSSHGYGGGGSSSSRGGGGGRGGESVPWGTSAGGTAYGSSGAARGAPFAHGEPVAMAAPPPRTAASSQPWGTSGDVGHSHAHSHAPPRRTPASSPWGTEADVPGSRVAPPRAADPKPFGTSADVGHAPHPYSQPGHPGVSGGRAAYGGTPSGGAYRDAPGHYPGSAAPASGGYRVLNPPGGRSQFSLG